MQSGMVSLHNLFGLLNCFTVFLFVCCCFLFSENKDRKKACTCSQCPLAGCCVTLGELLLLLSGFQTFQSSCLSVSWHATVLSRSEGFSAVVWPLAPSYHFSMHFKISYLIFSDGREVFMATRWELRKRFGEGVYPSPQLVSSLLHHSCLPCSGTLMPVDIQMFFSNFVSLLDPREMFVRVN